MRLWLYALAGFKSIRPYGEYDSPLSVCLGKDLGPTHGTLRKKGVPAPS